MEEKEQNAKKTENRFAYILRRIFVHNIGWKLFSLASAFVIWALAAGLW